MLTLHSPLCFLIECGDAHLVPRGKALEEGAQHQLCPQVSLGTGGRLGGCHASNAAAFGAITPHAACRFLQVRTHLLPALTST